MGVLEVQRVVDAPADLAWEIIADVENYHKLAAGLSNVEILEGDGVGMRRRCYDNKNRGWDEECPLWDEEGREYRFIVDTQAEDYHQPFVRLQGTWRVEEQSQGTVIGMRFDYVIKYGPLGWLMGLLSMSAGRRDAEDLLEKWEAAIEARVNQS